MAAQKGRDVLLKIKEDDQNYVTVGGLRSRQISLNAQSVDVTSADSPGVWRELLSGGGVKKAAISGGGIFKDAASDARIRELFFNGDIREWKLLIPNFGDLEGSFQIVTLEYKGEYASEVTFEISLESASQIIFKAA